MKPCHNHNVKVESEYVFSQLRSFGGRITEQRRALVEAIVNFQGPFCADDLLGILKEGSMDLATVYRSLSAFAELGLLSTVDFGDGMLRYEYLSGDEHHHHIICTNCKQVEPVNFCVVQGQEQIIEHMGYKNVSHKLEFFGLCKKCSRK